MKSIYLQDNRALVRKMDLLVLDKIGYVLTGEAETALLYVFKRKREEAYSEELLDEREEEELLVLVVKQLVVQLIFFDRSEKKTIISARQIFKAFPEYENEWMKLPEEEQCADAEVGITEILSDKELEKSIEKIVGELSEEALREDSIEKATFQAFADLLPESSNRLREEFSIKEWFGWYPADEVSRNYFYPWAREKLFIAEIERCVESNRRLYTILCNLLFFEKNRLGLADKDYTMLFTLLDEKLNNFSSMRFVKDWDFIENSIYYCARDFVLGDRIRKLLHRHCEERLQDEKLQNEMQIEKELSKLLTEIDLVAPVAEEYKEEFQCILKSRREWVEYVLLYKEQLDEKLMQDCEKAEKYRDYMVRHFDFDSRENSRFDLKKSLLLRVRHLYAIMLAEGEGVPLRIWAEVTFIAELLLQEREHINESDNIEDLVCEDVMICELIKAEIGQTLLKNTGDDSGGFSHEIHKEKILKYQRSYAEIMQNSSTYFEQKWMYIKRRYITIDKFVIETSIMPFLEEYFHLEEAYILSQMKCFCMDYSLLEELVDKIEVNESTLRKLLQEYEDALVNVMKNPGHIYAGGDEMLAIPFNRLRDALLKFQRVVLC